MVVPQRLGFYVHVDRLGDDIRVSGTHGSVH